MAALAVPHPALPRAMQDTLRVGKVVGPRVWDGLRRLPDHTERAAVAGSCHGVIRPAVTASKKSIAAAVDATAKVLAKSTGVPSHAIPDGDLSGGLRPQ
jgi:hypothetical protein